MSRLNDLKLPEYYRPFVEPVIDQDLISGLIMSGNEALDLYRSISERSADYAYAPEKWSVKEVLAHVIDTERVFAYRALAFSRNDNNSLSGFDQDAYVKEGNASNRRLHKIVEEFTNVRAATVDLFSGLSEEMIERFGNASGTEISVRALGYLIMGHEHHHRNVIRSKYLQ